MSFGFFAHSRYIFVEVYAGMLPGGRQRLGASARYFFVRRETAVVHIAPHDVCDSLDSRKGGVGFEIALRNNLRVELVCVLLQVRRLA